jgi:sugar lactone lactonase YvrE
MDTIPPASAPAPEPKRPWGWIIFGLTALLLLVSWLAGDWARRRGWTDYPYLSSRYVSALLIDGQDNLWVGTHTGLNIMDASGKWSAYSTSNSGLANNWVEALAIDSRGRLRIGTKDGLSTLGSNGKWSTYNTDNSPLLENQVTAVLIEAQDVATQTLFTERENIWIGTPQGLNVRTLDGRWENYPAGKSAVTGAVESLALDAEGNVWVGASGGLLKHMPAGYFKRVTTADKVQALAIDQQGNAWLGTNKGLHVLTPEGYRRTYTTSNSGLAANNVTSLALDRQGRAWAGTTKGLCLLDADGNWAAYTRANSGLAGDFVTTLLVDQQGRLWVGASGGLNVFEVESSLPPGLIYFLGLLRTFAIIALIVEMGVGLFRARKRRSALQPVARPEAAAPAQVPREAQAALERGRMFLAQGRREAAVAHFTSAFRAGSPEIRQQALDELEKMGEVEIL